VLAAARASAPGPRAVFVDIKVEDTDGEQGDGGEGEEATGGERDKAGEEVEKQEEEEEAEEQEDEEDEEEDEKQQHEQHTQVPCVSLEGRMAAGADAVAPSRRARPPRGSYADTVVDYDEGEEEDEDEEEEWGGDEEDEEGGKEDPRDPHALESGASIKGGSESVRPQRLTPGARLDPGSTRARIRAPGRVAYNAIQDTGVQQQQEEEEAGVDPAHMMHEGGGPAGSSRYAGVTWHKKSGKWIARCRGTYLGLHTTEKAAAREYSKYLKDNIDNVKLREASTSQFTGVSWKQRSNKWAAKCKGKYLGLHTTEEAAARAYNMYLKDGSVPEPAERGGWGCSVLKGVYWDNNSSKWMAKCKGIYLGLHTSEEAAARAYNVEAERIGRPLNGIPPAATAADGGAGPTKRAGAGAGTKRAPPKTTAAPTTGKTTKRAAPTAPVAPSSTKRMKL